VTHGAVAATADERPVPIASLPKLMTAYLTLTLHPLALGASVPTIVISETDIVRYAQDVDEDQSTLQVVAGERLAEY
jgi:D-alanyl-D-alanine carboxypeptidase (penicillin-binding protein 5/6)